MITIELDKFQGSIISRKSGGFDEIKHIHACSVHVVNGEIEAVLFIFLYMELSYISKGGIRGLKNSKNLCIPDNTACGQFWPASAERFIPK